MSTIEATSTCYVDKIVVLKPGLFMGCRGQMPALRKTRKST